MGYDRVRDARYGMCGRTRRAMLIGKRALPLRAPDEKSTLDVHIPMQQMKFVVAVQHLISERQIATRFLKGYTV